MAKLDWQRPKYAWERNTNEDHLVQIPEPSPPKKRRIVRDPKERKREEKAKRKLKKLMKSPAGKLYQKKHIIRVHSEVYELETYIQIQCEHETKNNIRITRSGLIDSVCVHISKVNPKYLDQLGFVLKIQIYQYQIVYDTCEEDQTRAGSMSSTFYVVARAAYDYQKNQFGVCEVVQIGLYKGNSSADKLASKENQNWQEDVPSRSLKHVCLSEIKNLLQKPVQTFFRDSRLKRDDRFEVDRSGRLTPYGIYMRQDKVDRVRIRFILTPPR